MPDVTTYIPWNEVPESVWREWREIFQSYPDLSDLPAHCPFCGYTSLHQHYYIRDLRKILIQDNKITVGGARYWSWCSSCSAYQHANGFAPLSWVATTLTRLVVPLSRLGSAPENLERERLRSITAAEASTVE
ncbi:hypothetical protein [Deinococcus sp. UYEF24]